MIDLYRSLAENHANSTQLNFTSCTYADLNDVDVRDSIARFMFGPNDSYSGKVVTLSRGNKLPIVISGGIPPYTAAVIPISGIESANVIATVGNGLLTIEAVSIAGKKKAASYQIVVNDATNRNVRSMQINVPDEN